MEESNEYVGNPHDYVLFVELLPEKGMFLVDKRLNKDLCVVYRSRDNTIERAFIKRYQANPGKSEFKISIEGAYWGSLNGKLFDDIPALVHALSKRGLTHVDF